VDRRVVISDIFDDLYSDEERSRDGVGSCLKEVTGKR
jgi:hypothetical protein